MLSFVEAILLAAGRGVRTGWGWLGEGVTWVGQVLDLLTPLLGPVFAHTNPWCTRGGLAVYGLLDLVPSWIGLVLISAGAGLLMVVIFRWTSNQQAIRRIRDDIKANLLVLRLFKEDLGVALRAQGRLLLALLRLQGRMLLPIAVMTLPMIVLMAQMNLRYQHRSLRSGEQTVVRARLQPGPEPAPAVELETEDGGAVVEVGPIAGGGQLVWRVRAVTGGSHQIAAVSGEHRLAKAIVIGEDQRLVSAVRPGQSWMAQLLHPAEPPLPPNVNISSLEVEYPRRPSWFDGADWWILWFIVLSMACAGVSKRALGVAM